MAEKFLRGRIASQRGQLRGVSCRATVQSRHGVRVKVVQCKELEEREE
jgi:hypothetical protein